MELSTEIWNSIEENPEKYERMKTMAPVTASGRLKKEYCSWMLKLFKCSVVCGIRKWNTIAVTARERLVITRS